MHEPCTLKIASLNWCYGWYGWIWSLWIGNCIPNHHGWILWRCWCCSINLWLCIVHDVMVNELMIIWGIWTWIQDKTGDISCDDACCACIWCKMSLLYDGSRWYGVSGDEYPSIASPIMHVWWCNIMLLMDIHPHKLHALIIHHMMFLFCNSIIYIKFYHPCMMIINHLIIHLHSWSFNWIIWILMCSDAGNTSMIILTISNDLLIIWQLWLSITRVWLSKWLSYPN